MLQRVMGILKLDVETYEEVEHDPEATKQAAMIVALVAVASAVAQYTAAAAQGGSPTGSAFGGLVGAFIGWFVSSWVTLKVGTGIFKGQADLGEMLRVLGFAQIPGVLAVLSPIPLVGPLAGLVGGIWTLVCYFIAVRQGLDISNGQTVATILIVMLVYFAVIFAISAAFALLLVGVLGGAGALSQ